MTLLSVREIGQRLHLRKAQVRRLILSGALGPALRNDSGHFRVHEQDVARFQRKAAPLAVPRRTRAWRSEMFWLYDQDAP